MRRVFHSVVLEHPALKADERAECEAALFESQAEAYACAFQMLSRKPKIAVRVMPVPEPAT